MSHRKTIIAIGLLGTLIAGFLVGRLLAEFDWNPTVTIKFGEVFLDQNMYAEDLLGEIVVAPSAGHDGKFFFSQAMDPLYLEPDVHAVFLDRPAYRAQRMFYPLVAGLGGLASATVTAWGLILVNVLAMGVGTAATALVARELGISPWFGLAFVLNPGLMIIVNIDGAGITAFAALMLGVLFVMKGNLVGAAAALTVAALSRETMLIGAVGLAWYWYRTRKKVPWPMLSPLFGVVAWWVYVQWRLEDGLTQDTQALGAPFVGFLQAFRGWLETPGSSLDLLTGTLLLFVSVSVAVRALRKPSALGWAVAGFALLGIMLSEPVWANYFDSSRALAPVLTAYLLLVPADIKASREGRSTALAPGANGRSEGGRSTSSDRTSFRSWRSLAG